MLHRHGFSYFLSNLKLQQKAHYLLKNKWFFSLVLVGKRKYARFPRAIREPAYGLIYFLILFLDLFRAGLPKIHF
jgi:hypothetical protein